MKTKNLSINLPVPSFDYRDAVASAQDKTTETIKRATYVVANVINNVLVSIKKIFSPIKRISFRRRRVESDGESYQYNERKPKFNIKNILRFFAVVIVAIVILLIVSTFVKSKKQSTSANVDTTVQPALATQDINKDFNFPIKDSNSESIGNITYTLQKAELRKEIVVKGQKATAVDGRAFLIIYLKVKNGLDKTIQMNTRDYIRLSVNGNKDEWLAPDIHNDPVEIQAISTKYTRLGFAINDTDKDLLLQVGEIEGDKQEIPLNLK